MGRTQRLAQPQEFGKYQLVARLSHGRMGDVYKAKSHGVEGFEKILVVKVINQGLVGVPNFVETLIEEAKRSVSLSHANVAQVYDLGRAEDEDQFYIATEFVNGFDLGRAVSLAGRSDRDWTLEMSIFVMSEVAKGLDYAHRRKDFNFNNLNILHGDMSPHNIMLSFDGEVKVTDFGISRALDLVPPLDTEDTIRRHLYAAPEVVREQEPTQQSDIFSLGLVLYELLAGEHPYRGGTERDVIERARTARIPPITQHADVPRQLQQIVESMLVPDPAGRATSAGSIYEELIGFLFGNNLRSDSRSLGLFMQELRRDEQRIAPEERTQEVGLEEISMTDLRGVLGGSESEITEAPGVAEVSEPTHSDLPSAKIQQMISEKKDNADSDQPPLPGALQEYFLSARAGDGKAVLLSGQFGAGREYLPDRLVDALGWRGNTQAFGIQTTRDDIYRPFGVLSDLILRCLHETISGQADPRDSALKILRELDVAPEALDTLRGIWGMQSAPRIGYERRLSQLSDLFIALLEDFCRNGPVVLVIDKVEHIDGLTMDVLREFVARIGEMPAMLVLATAADELMRSAFDRGQSENLEAIRVVGEEPPELSEINGLSGPAANILKLLGLSQQPMSQADLQQLLSLPSDDLMNSLRELADRGFVRIPRTGIFVAGVPELVIWVEKRFDRQDVERAAGALARYYTHRVVTGEIDRLTPTLMRLYAYAGDRRRMLSRAEHFGRWLEREGWQDVALDFYKHTADLLARDAIGSPQARIRYILSRAELALELSRLDEARASLEPVAALTESVRHERGLIRGQLLLGQMATQQDDLDDALKYFRRAASAARGINDPSLLARSMLALAGWHERFGDTRTSQRMLEGAMNLFNRWGTYRMDLNSRALMLHRASSMWADRGMLHRAERVCEDLEMLAEQSELAPVECRAKWARARVESIEGRYDRALELMDRAQATAYRAGLTALRIEILRDHASIALDADNYERAIDLSSRLVDLAQQHEDLFSAQRGRDLEATAKCLVGTEIEASVAHLESSLERAQSRDVPRDVYRCHQNLARAYEALGRDTQAETHRREATRLGQKFRYRSAA
ncbi:MAG: protein kinase domain-containing protein [Myxococcota bacterium]